MPSRNKTYKESGRKTGDFISGILLTILLFTAGIPVFSQQYNNEWINYSQTYYKFKVGVDGLYRIPQSTLDQAGLANTDVRNFELWKNGQQVPFYTSSTSGALPTSGYIEFWGEINDGSADKVLYRNPAYQHSSEISLFTDTSVYFLSVNTNQSGFIYSDPGNDVAGSPLPVEPYYMHKAGNYYRNRMNPGFAAVVGEYVYSSSFDKGEFWSSNPIRPSTPLVTNNTNLKVYGSGPGAVLTYGAMGDALNPRYLKVSINGTPLQDTVLDLFTDVHSSVAVPIGVISGGSAAVRFENTSAVTQDRLVISYFELSYPRLFDFNNQKAFEFALPATGTGYKLEISNFNSGSEAPLLLDLTTGQRIVGDISTPGKVKVVLGPGGARKFVLVNKQAANIKSVGSLVPKTFTEYLHSENQGDYLIISNKALFNGTQGNNPVEDYKNYRSSAAGGGYDALVVDIDELVDQFAFGIKKHPLSIKNFLRYARSKFSSPLKHVFLIGRGLTYSEFRAHESNLLAEQLNMVPTFGSPASDNMLSSANSSSPIALTPIGRLSVVSSNEIENYLEKVKEYEYVQKNAGHTLAEREWMKNVVHVTGSSDPYLGTVLCNYMNVYKQVIQDTSFGANVSSFCKSSTNNTEQINNAKIADLFAEGISVLTYFGHSSTTTLEFNLDDPESYNNAGKYPVFFVNGCNAGNFFTYNPARMVVKSTLSENFVLAKQRGSIAFVASSHFGIVNYLNIYLNNLYKLISRSDFGHSLGETMRDALQKTVDVTGPNDFYARVHAEEITLHGDPALHINELPKPDYVIEESQIRIDPSFISIAESSFPVKIRIANIGKASNDSIYVSVRREYPDGSTAQVYNKRIRGIQYADSLVVHIPINALSDKGSNKITIFVDENNEIEEMSETNNSATKEVFIFEDEARTIYPYQFSIINNSSQKLFASTADPFSPTKQYIMEIDTTETYDSPLKVTKSVSSAGGLLEFDPGITYSDQRVYYWRVSPVIQTGADNSWSNSSFTFMEGTKEGFGQMHFYQHRSSLTQRMHLSPNRAWEFGMRTNYLFALNTVYPTGGSQDADFSVDVNGSNYIFSACVGQSLIFNVFDSITFKPWKNVDETGNNLFLSGSVAANCAVSRNYNFEFSYMTPESRKNMIRFMDSIPDGNFVIVRNIPVGNVLQNKYVDTWQSDTLINGQYNSVYHRLLAAGFTDVDSFYRPRVFNFIYKKGSLDFIPQFDVSQGIYDRISTSAECITPDTLGYITSPLFGPASRWDEAIWNGSEVEAGSHDNPTVNVVGIDNSGIETVLFTMDKNTHNYDLSSIDPQQYPYMKLRMRNADSLLISPYQLSDWKIYGQPLPEGAIAPNLSSNIKDTLEIGEPLKFSMAFKNVSKYPFDSLAVKLNIVDGSNVPKSFVTPKLKPLISGDTVMLQYEIDSKDYPGTNTVFLEFNPDKDQPEQYQFNNFLYKSVYVKTDAKNPLLDVTFDGVHILNRDLVSAKPHIRIKLTDDAKFLLLNDTAVSTVQVRYPDGTIRTHHFDNDTLRFTPATSSSDNSAIIDFYPQFDGQYNPEGDEYELIINAKDRSGNKAGATEYRIAFTVVNKAMISNLLNYPNPFTTSTAFVFTITGSEIPQNMKIQILTVTGKIVREITKEELGPLRIGRNITEFKWDGSDQFGQRLANGVYIYRFVTSLNGKRMEKYRAKGDNTDMYFNNGYGKMYLMR